MESPPTDPKDVAVAAMVRGLLGAVPGAGSALVELANLFVIPHEKRKQRWMQGVADAINQIQTELGKLPQALQEDEQFISFLYQATQVALRNHQNEKLNALRTALVSAAKFSRDEADLAFLYLRYVDELSVSHIRILSFLERHAERVGHLTNLDAILSFLQSGMPMGIDRSVFRVVMRDLEARSLLAMIDVDDFPEYESGANLRVGEDSRPNPVHLDITPLGRGFVAFIAPN